MHTTYYTVLCKSNVNEIRRNSRFALAKYSRNFALHENDFSAKWTRYFAVSNKISAKYSRHFAE